MPLLSERLTNRLSSEGDRTEEFFSGLPEDCWDSKVYTDGASWSVHAILVHLVQAENAILRLLHSILAGGAGTPEDFDLNAYNERKVTELADAAVPDLLAAFRDVRSRTLAAVERLSDEDLAREGRHPFLGVAPIEEMIKLLYRHTQLHQRDIRRTLNPPD